MVYVFGECELEMRRFELRRQGQVRPVEPQVFDVLVLLLRARDRVVSKEEILETVWGHRFVGESALFSRIKSLRQAVGDGRVRLDRKALCRERRRECKKQRRAHAQDRESFRSRGAQRGFRASVHRANSV